MRSKLSAYESFRYRYRAWKYRWQTESAEVATLLRSLRRGQTALDIGAHKGAMTYWMRKQVGASGRVLAFEPQPELAEYLRKVRRTFSFHNVEVIEAALSSQPGVATLCRETAGPSPGASLERWNTNKTHKFEVQVATLDQMLAERGIEDVDFIKCDAEGHELEVFRGAERVLTTSRPPILFECEQRHCGNHEIGDVFDLLTSYGYQGQFFRRKKLDSMAEFQQMGSSPEDPDYVYNFLFQSSQSSPGQTSQARAA